MRKIIIVISVLIIVSFIIVASAEPRVVDGITELPVRHDTRDILVSDAHRDMPLRERTTIALAAISLDTIDMQIKFRDNYSLYSRFDNVTMLDGQTEAISFNGKRYIKWEYEVVGEDGFKFLVYAVRDYSGGEITYNPNWLTKDKEVMR